MSAGDVQMQELKAVADRLGIQCQPEIKADEVGPSLRFNTVDVQSRNTHSQAKRTERAIEDAF